ncbi:MAG TPA: ABC transporter permease [Candidatus Acidoferrales bacterium]|nr:ABC transporter permease [Candidatus Acidoferrales bacterium]
MDAMLGWLWQDLRLAIRGLNRDRRFTLLAVLALALGIGAATVIFSAFYGVILNTFPFKHADQVTSFAITDLAHPSNLRESFLFPEFVYYREHNHAFQDLSGEFGGFGTTPLRYTTGNSTYQFDADYLSANSFKFFGVPPVLGRLPGPEDVKPGAPPVFVIGYKLWQRQFNGDRSVVGKSFTLNGVPRTLIGIMSPRFRWAWVDAWVPFSVDPALAQDNVELQHRFLYTVGRLKPGVTLKEAAADLNVVAHQYAKIQPALYPKQFTVTTGSLAERVTGGFKTLLYPVLAAALLLLLIACSNVANLLLTRATVRDREIAVRASLGASRWRLVRQLLVESFALAGAGCVGGCFLAWAGITALVPLVPYDAFPQEAVIQLNGPVLGFAVGIAMLTVLLCGLAPAFHAVRGNLQGRLRGSGKGTGGESRHGVLRATLVVAEVALSIVLLVGAGLMMRSFVGVESSNFGFDAHNLLVTSLSLPQDTQKTPQETRVMVQKILDALRTLPGVTAVTTTVARPPLGSAQSQIEITGKTHSDTWSALFDLCSQDYFTALGLHPLRGELLSREDVDSARHVAVVNEAFARRYFPGDNPIGHNVEFKVLETKQDPSMPLQIVGVVSDVKNRGLQRPSAPEAYIPYTLFRAGAGALMIRTAVNPDSLLPSIRRTVWSVDNQVALTDTQTVQDSLQRYVYAYPEFEFAALGVFAAIGLLLVVIGVYSVMAYAVSLQTHEIGIRLALGAQSSDVLRMVLRKGMRLIAIGAVVGILASIGATRLIAHQLVGVKPTDPWTFAAVVAVIFAAGLAACVAPARRATKVDPLTALRYE